MKYLFFVVLLFGFSACTVVPTTIEKTVTIEKDEAGKVLKRVEVERATQQLSAGRIQLEAIKIE